MLIESSGIGAGLLVTQLLGLYCDRFLKTGVTTQLPCRFKSFETTESQGGGEQLGVLERFLFFATVWLAAYEIAGGWLVFKVAAKWASWEHIIKIPEFTTEDDRDRYLRDKVDLASRLLGRFFNGTLYNIFCGGIGGVIAWIINSFSQQLVRIPTWPWLCVAATLLIGANVGLTYQGLAGKKKNKKKRAE
jgi:hypothetical protein